MDETSPTLKSIYNILIALSIEHIAVIGIRGLNKPMFSESNYEFLA